MSNILFKRSIEGFSFFKNSLVDAIENTTSIYHKTEKEQHWTDYHLSKDIPRKYESIIMPHVLTHMRAFEQAYNFSGIELHHLWFQKYQTGDFHSWHVHPYCHFTNIVYVKLPNASSATEIADVSLDLVEGDIVTFPSFILHQSPKIDSDEKIIISFNTNII